LPQVISSLRPGIFLDYENSGIFNYNNENIKKIGIIADFNHEVCEFYGINQVKEIFSENNNIFLACKAAFENGASVIKIIPEDSENILENLEDVYFIIQENENLNLQEIISNFNENYKEKIGIITGNYSTEWVNLYNSERIILIVQEIKNENNEILPKFLLSASLAGKLSSNLNDIILKNTGSLTENILESEIDNYINSGIVLFEEKIPGNLEVIKLVNSLKENNDLKSILISDNIIFDLRNILQEKLETSGNKLAKNTIKNLIILKLKELKKSGMLDSYEQPIISQDNNTCIIELIFNINKNFNQINLAVKLEVKL